MNSFFIVIVNTARNIVKTFTTINCCNRKNIALQYYVTLLVIFVIGKATVGESCLLFSTLDQLKISSHAIYHFLFVGKFRENAIDWFIFLSYD